MDIEKKINAMGDVFVSIGRNEGVYYVCVNYPETWTAYSTEDDSIKVKSGNSDGLWYYFGNKMTEIHELIDFIEDTIQANLEAIKKADLYNAKVEELKKLFADENKSYKDLERLSFSMKENISVKPKITKTTKSRGPKKADKEAEPITYVDEVHNESVGEKDIELDNNTSIGVTPDGVDLDELRG